MALDIEHVPMHEDLERLHQHIKTSHLFDLPIHSQHVRHTNASMDEEKPRKRVRRSGGKKGRGKKEMQEQVMDMLAALQIAHITNDRETRENSGAKGDLPKWVKEGIEENEEWLKEMKAQQQKFEQSLKGLKEWWKVMTKEGKARENEVAAEIRSN